MLPLDLVARVERTDRWVDVKVVGVAPRSDSLGEQCQGVLKHKGRLYRVDFVRGNAYWRAEMGPWEDPFPQVRDGEDEIEVEEVREVEVRTVSYEPVD
jgi:hypothetical protein